MQTKSQTQIEMPFGRAWIKKIKRKDTPLLRTTTKMNELSRRKLNHKD